MKILNLPDSAIGRVGHFLNDTFLRGPGTDALVLAGLQKRLGELYEAKGDLANAESHYSAFLMLWGTADPELQPKVADVRRRLAALRAKVRLTIRLLEVAHFRDRHYSRARFGRTVAGPPSISIARHS